MSVFYQVKPRYSAGSPALVSYAQALDVLKWEREFYVAALEGAWGEDWRQSAQSLGLEGVVECHEVYSYHIQVHDLATHRIAKLKDGRYTEIRRPS